MESSPYDPFAWFYQRYWADGFSAWQMPALQTLLLQELPKGARVLDLCCGTGTLGAKLASLGFRVTGIDASGEMLRYARAASPEETWLHAKADQFEVPQPVAGAVCSFDSLNHLLEPEAVQSAMRHVGEALQPGGIFVFDINTDAAYGEQWDQTATVVEPDHAFFLRGAYDRVARRGRTEITMFRLLEQWERYDVTVPQRPWTPEEITSMLQQTGFREIRHFRAAEDLGLAGNFGLGRVYFHACKPDLSLAKS